MVIIIIIMIITDFVGCTLCNNYNADPLAPYQVRMTAAICLSVVEVYNSVVQTEGGMYDLLGTRKNYYNLLHSWQIVDSGICSSNSLTCSRWSIQCNHIV